MSGTPLSAFEDFVIGTSQAEVTGPEYIVNEAAKNTYSLARLMEGEKRMIRGGSSIQEKVVFDDNGSFAFYQPGNPQAFGNAQRIKKIRADWRFSIAHMQWDRQEIMLNEGIRAGGDERFTQFVSIRNEKETLMWTSKWNGMENALWVQPNLATMEDADGLNPYSIPCFINEYANGLFQNDASGGTWTTVEGINPAAADVNGGWDNKRQTYTSAAAGNAGNVLGAFDQMFMDVEYQAPQMHSQYFNDPAYSQQVIETSRQGRAHYQQIIREGQDHFVNPGQQDPAYPNPQFYGIPVTRVSELETAELYDDGSSGNATEAGTGGTEGPRYYWRNAKYLFPVFHDEMYFHKDTVRQAFNQVDTRVMPVLTWYSLFCSSRRHQGLVSPDSTANPDMTFLY